MLMIEGQGEGKCDLTNREGEGCHVQFSDGARGFLSWSGLKKYVTMRAKMDRKKSSDSLQVGGNMRSPSVPVPASS